MTFWIVDRIALVTLNGIYWKKNIFGLFCLSFSSFRRRILQSLKHLSHTTIICNKFAHTHIHTYSTKLVHVSDDLVEEWFQLLDFPLLAKLFNKLSKMGSPAGHLFTAPLAQLDSLLSGKFDLVLSRLYVYDSILTQMSICILIKSPKLFSCCSNSTNDKSHLCKCEF